MVRKTEWQIQRKDDRLGGGGRRERVRLIYKETNREIKKTNNHRMRYTVQYICRKRECKKEIHRKRE